jgi:hypothetical protein
MNRIQTKIVCLTIILILLVVVVSFSKKIHESFQVNKQSTDEFFYKQLGPLRRNFAIDPVDPNKNMRIQQFDDISEILYGRKTKNIYKDFSLGFYFKLDNPNTINHYLFSAKDSSDNETMNISIDSENLIIVFEDNEQVIPLDKNYNEEYSYLFLKANLQTTDFIPKLTIILNNTTYQMVLRNREAERLNIKKFIFGNNSRSATGFKGSIGKIKLYNEIVSREVMCKHFNCNLSCFIPDGTKTYNNDPNVCIKDCMTQCGDIMKCQQICINCEVEGEFWDKEEKSRRCPWLSDIKIMDATLPEAPQIRGFPGDQKILIEWRKPFNGRSDITNYIILYYETFNKQSGINVNISAKSDNDILDYPIENIKNKTYYDIEVRAVNGKGIGPPSNIVSIAPNGNVLSNNNQNMFNELGDDLQKQVDNTRMDFMCNVNNFDSVGHTLDYYDEDMTDIKKYIETIKK